MSDSKLLSSAPSQEYLDHDHSLYCEIISLYNCILLLFAYFSPICHQHIDSKNAYFNNVSKDYDIRQSVMNPASEIEWILGGG